MRTKRWRWTLRCRRRPAGRRWGAVNVGDRLIGADGLPVEVLKATDVQYGRRCYQVTFADGTSVVASDGHLWQTKVAEGGRVPRVRTTGDLVADGRKFMVPMPAPWKMPDADLPVDPYVLGMWLGDGSKGQPYITAGDEDVDETVRQLNLRGADARKLVAPGRAWRIALSRVTGFHKGAPLGDALRALPCYRNKHVPPAYFLGSIDQRTDLLRGLMDSDGHAGPSGGCTFVGDDQLSADLLVLLRSLGQTARPLVVS